MFWLKNSVNFHSSTCTYVYWTNVFFATLHKSSVLQGIDIVTTTEGTKHHLLVKIYKVQPKTGHEDPEGEERYSYTVYLTSALDGVGG